MLVWSAAMLALVVISFGLLVGYLAWHSRLTDVDARLRARADLLVNALQPAAGGTFDLRLPAAVLQPGDELHHIVWTDTGGVIDRSDAGLDIPAPRGPGVWTRDGLRELVVRVPSGAHVLVGRPLASVYADVQSLFWTMAGVGAIALAVSVLGGWLLVGRALRPIDRIGRTARAMVSGDLSARIPVDDVESELGNLARALNEAFERLHEAIERQRRFTADASHELRTPLTALSTEVQWSLARERSADEYRQSLETCRRAATRMQGVVERLLTLARVESGETTPVRARVEFGALVRQAVDDLRPLSSARGLEMRLEAESATVVGEADALHDAVTQVIVNAVEYNSPGGSVLVRLRASDEHAELTVADTGVGIAEADLPRVFEPFFRADPARQRRTGGVGLGLAIAHAVVTRHGGLMRCESAVGRGTTVTITLPFAERKTARLA